MVTNTKDNLSDEFPDFAAFPNFTDFTGYLVGYILVEDTQNRRKLISNKTGEIFDFPFNYQPQLTENNGKIVVVSDDKLAQEGQCFPQNLGVVTINGRLITPCINAGISIADAQIGTYFVRQDTLAKVSERGYEASDSLVISDKNWFWYNIEGKRIYNEPFRYPINFDKGLGIGMQGELFGIFRSDGRIIAPPQYVDIRRTQTSDFFYLFRNQGLTVTASLKNRQGKTLVEEERYDGISSFYGRYALVSSARKIGLIDTLGNEIITPQELSMTNTSNLLDSINLFNKELYIKAKLLKDYDPSLIYSNLLTMPLDFPYGVSDTLISASLRNTVDHLILDKIKDNVIWRANDVKIERSKSNVGNFYFKDDNMCGSGRMSEDELRSHICSRLIATEKTVAFTLSKKRSYGSERFAFYNFYKKNNLWQELKINDLLSIRGEKHAQLNGLLIQKIKALHDAEIDCRDTSIFLETVENRFLLTKDGLDFHFDSQKSDRYSDDTKFVIVSFTWAELQPFLKMRL
jgi:hypothetical protein